jgi:DNA-binding NarL/FixJ family response regulator
MAFMGWKGIIKGVGTAAASEDIYASLLARCKELAGDKRLTQRETEVLILLAQGRSMPFIQNELHLSEGTVKTHVKHIYAKLDIHTKQELLDFMGTPAQRP